MARIIWNYFFLVAWDTEEHLIFRLPWALSAWKSDILKESSLEKQTNNSSSYQSEFYVSLLFINKVKRSPVIAFN